jgi:filamentous hemagglutinin
VTADVRNLTIESLVDTTKAHADQLSLSGQIGFGSTGISGVTQKAKGDVALVSQQSGIHAGTGGLDLNIEKQTTLVGGLITSQATSDHNTFNTGTLTVTDIDTHSSWKAETYGGSIGVGGLSPAPPVKAGEKETGKAYSAIGANIGITITDPAHQTQDIGTIRRDTQNTNTSLPGLPDLENILRDQYKTQADLQQAQKTMAGLVGDVASEFYEQAARNQDQARMDYWKEGGAGRVLLHTIGSGILGGVNGWEGALKGAAGAATASLLAPAIGKLVDGMLKGTSVEGTEDGKWLAALIGEGLSALVAGAVGGGEGASYGAAQYQYNYLKHAEREEFTRVQASCENTKDATDCARAEELREISYGRDQKIEGCVGSSSSDCITARTDLRITAAEYLDAALSGDGDDLDGLSLLDRHMVFLDAWKYAVDGDPRDSQQLTDAASTLTSAAAKALLTGSKDEIARIIRDPIIIGAIAFGGAGNARGVIGESAVVGRSSSDAIDGIDSAVAAGASLVGADGDLRRAAGWVKPQKGVFDLVVHGEASGFFVQTADGNWTKISTNNLSQYMKANGYAGEPVRLISCGTGACNATAAQKLANQIGAPVTAPSDTVWIHPNGTLTVGPNQNVNSGTWNSFSPGTKP